MHRAGLSGGGCGGGGDYHVLLLTLYLAPRWYFTRIRSCGPDGDPRGRNVYHASLVDEECEGGEGCHLAKVTHLVRGT